MKRSISFFILAAAALMATNAQTQQPVNNVLDVKTSLTDSNIVYPETYESNTHKLLEGWYMKNYMAHDDRYSRQKDTNPSDEVVKERLAKLPTVIEMPFNSVVRSYIDRYTQRSREQVTVLLGLSHYYLPIFEQALEERGLPLELKYLPVIESALDPNAVSKHGATGLWQFMITTAKGMGLEVNTLVDERRDPILSSKKAAQYLADLYATYNDWSLAIAAYNCGPGAINKAIRRAGGDPSSHDFWSIYNYLTPETRGYVPMFIAANYVMNYYPEHNLSPVIPTKPLVTDTIQVQDRIHFNQISEVLDIPVEELRVLNPQFRADIIPGSEEKTYTLVLPSQQIHAYLMSEDAIKEHDAEKYAKRDAVEPGDKKAESGDWRAETGEGSPHSVQTTIKDGEGKEGDVAAPEAMPVAAAASTKGVKTVTHKVKPGETLASIAQTYEVTPQDIKTWNSLRRNAVRTGQILRINTATAEGEAEQLTADTSVPAVQEKAAAQAKTQTSAKKTPAKPAVTSHSVKSGESLSSISKKYGVSIAELKKANGMTNDNIRAGATLKIPAKGTASKGKTSTTKRKRKRR